ncbi:MAG TPA: GAF and ANTAR domain-containing protein [Kineosporiaceae bacterium]|nr:GAF and ANTAR domain-containing protein [Kineosporiaceae bacterium]
MTDHTADRDGRDDIGEPDSTRNSDGIENLPSEVAGALGAPVADSVRAYSELAKIVLNQQPLGAVLRRIAELAVEIIPGADDVSVTLIEHNRARSVAFTGPLAIALDERQYEAGFGPCMDAAVTGQLIQIEDTGNSTVYPEFSRQARRHGIRHTLSIGMPTQQGTTGALNIYGAGAAGPFDSTARDIAATFAGYAAIALLNAALYAGTLDEVSQMRRALASRASIEQAKGILMRDQRCTADEAFAILREKSSRTNRKLRDIAQSIIDEAIA